MFYKYKEHEPIQGSRILVIKENTSLKSGFYGKFPLNQEDIWCYTEELIKFSKFVIEELEKEEVQKELTNGCETSVE